MFLVSDNKGRLCTSPYKNKMPRAGALPWPTRLATRAFGAEVERKPAKCRGSTGFARSRLPDRAAAKREKEKSVERVP